MSELRDLIVEDHRTVEALFLAYETGGQNQETVDELCSLLARHMRLEEDLVYPRIEQVADGVSLMLEAEREHLAAASLIERLRHESDPDQQAVLLLQLKQAVAQHVIEEESELLPLLDTAVSEADRSALAQAFAGAREAAV